MARSANNSGYPTYLPRSWRVVTIAGVTTVGLGFGLVEPALAEWLKQSAKPPARSSTRPVPAENGFTATIRRLMADSRRAAEQGDHAKAVQLAERAVKISEATAQLLGPTSECSPQETSRFLAEMRAARDGTAPAMAAQPAPSAPAPQLPPRSTVSNPPVHATAKATTKGAITPPAPARPSQSAVAATAKPQNPPAVAAAPKTAGAGARAATPPPAGNVVAAGAVRKSPEKQATQAGHSQVRSAQQPVPPAPAKATSNADQLLVQSRIAAANGDLDGAIELARQAAGSSAAPSFFGADRSTPQNAEATRWLERLLAQRETQQQRAIVRQHETSDEVFEPPIRVASKSKQKTMEAASVVAPVRNETMAPSTERAPDIEPAVARRQAEKPLAAAESHAAAEEAVWSEDLPAAQLPEVSVVREPVKFSRRSIAASAGWVDADALDRAAIADRNAEAQPASDPVTDSSPMVEPEAEEPPEFSIGEVPVNTAEAEVQQSVAIEAVSDDVVSESISPSTIEPRNESPSVPAVEMKSEEEVPQDAHQPVMERGPLRLRQHVPQMPETPSEPSSVEVSDAASEFPSTKVERAPLRFRKQPPIQTADYVAPEAVAQESEPVPQQAVPDAEPETRGTLRLRTQIQQVAGEFPDSSKGQATSQRRPSQSASGSGGRAKSIPSSFAEIPTESVAAPTDEPSADAPVQRFPVQRVLRLRQRIEEAASLNPGGQQSEPHQEPNIEERPASNETSHRDQSADHEAHRALSQQPIQSAARPAVKLRERARLKLDDSTVNSSSTAAPRVPAATRSPVVARSESNLWKSVNSTTNAQPSPAAQPTLTPPITQAGFEAGDVPSTSLQKTGLSINDSVSEPKSEFDVAPPPPEAPDSHPWHDDGAHQDKPWKSDTAVKKSSFALIDQLAEAYRIPVKTLVSVIMGAGAVLVVGGLVAVRAAMQRRHSA